MSWSVDIVDVEGNTRNCAECGHVAGCQIVRLAPHLASVLTSVDNCCDGHTAHGSARLECGGFEPIVTDEDAKDESDDDADSTDGAGQGQDGKDS